MTGEQGTLFHKTWIKGGQTPAEFMAHLVSQHKARYNEYPKRIDVNALNYKDWGIAQVAGVLVEPSLVIQENNFWVVHREAEE